MTANAASVPGRYRNSVYADVIREHRISGNGLGSTVLEEFEARLKEVDGKVDLRLIYERGTLVRSKGEWAVRSPTDPEIVRHYHADVLRDVVKSVPNNIDNTREFALNITLPEIAKLFDGRAKG